MAASTQVPRVALIHALPESVAPIATAFQRHWPEASTFNLLDESLARDREADGELTPAMTQRFLSLGRYAAESGSATETTAAILFTCSAFGPAIQSVKQDLDLPVMSPNEAAFEAALALGSKITLIVSFPPSAQALGAELEDLARDRGVELAVDIQLAEGALDALAMGNGEQHDALIAEAAQRSADCDVIVLGQFSMARAADLVASTTHATVLSTPAAAVKKLRALLEGGSHDT